MKSPKLLLARLLTLLICLFGQSAGAIEKLVVCYVEVNSALIPLAKLNGFDLAEGIDVELRSTPTGVIGMNAMFNNECDLSTASETPMVHFSLSRNDFRVLATLSSANNNLRILARTDKGIIRPADLRGKRIGTLRYTVAHTFLDSFLAIHALKPGDVEEVFLGPQELTKALKEGSVDAIAFWEPHISPTEAEMGAKVKQFGMRGLVITPILLMAKNSTVQKRHNAIVRLLKALVRAEEFAKTQPATARQMMASHLSARSDTIDLLWPLIDFGVRLDQTLPFLLENAARWRINIMPAGEQKATPNYLEFIDASLLTTVRPAAVTLIK